MKERLSEKESILQVLDLNVENDEQAQQQRQSNLKLLMNINKCFGLMFFSLTIIFTIDFFLTKTETYEIPSKCMDNGSCTISARTPSRRGPQYLYLEFRNFNQNYRNYVQSISQAQLFSDDASKEDTTECGRFTGHTPCGLIADTFPKCKIIHKKSD